MATTCSSRGKLQKRLMMTSRQVMEALAFFLDTDWKYAAKKKR